MDSYLCTLCGKSTHTVYSGFKSCPRRCPCLHLCCISKRSQKINLTSCTEKKYFPSFVSLSFLQMLSLKLCLSLSLTMQLFGLEEWQLVHVMAVLVERAYWSQQSWGTVIQCWIHHWQGNLQSLNRYWNAKLTYVYKMSLKYIYLFWNMVG